MARSLFCLIGLAVLIVNAGCPVNARRSFGWVYDASGPSIVVNFEHNSTLGYSWQGETHIPVNGETVVWRDWLFDFQREDVDWQLTYNGRGFTSPDPFRLLHKSFAEGEALSLIGSHPNWQVMWSDSVHISDNRSGQLLYGRYERQFGDTGDWTFSFLRFDTGWWWDHIDTKSGHHVYDFARDRGEMALISGKHVGDAGEVVWAVGHLRQACDAGTDTDSIHDGALYVEGRFPLKHGQIATSWRNIGTEFRSPVGGSGLTRDRQGITILFDQARENWLFRFRGEDLFRLSDRRWFPRSELRYEKRIAGDRIFADLRLLPTKRLNVGFRRGHWQWSSSHPLQGRIIFNVREGTTVGLAYHVGDIYRIECRGTQPLTWKAVFKVRKNAPRFYGYLSLEYENSSMGWEAVWGTDDRGNLEAGFGRSFHGHLACTWFF